MERNSQLLSSHIPRTQHLLFCFFPTGSKDEVLPCFLKRDYRVLVGKTIILLALTNISAFTLISFSLWTTLQDQHHFHLVIISLLVLLDFILDSYCLSLSVLGPRVRRKPEAVQGPPYSHGPQIICCLLGILIRGPRCVSWR